MAVLLMVLLLTLHAALVVGEVLPGPKWLAALEGVLALLVGLHELRGIADQDNRS